LGCASLLIFGACSDEDGGGGAGGDGGGGTTSSGTGPCAATACSDSDPDSACGSCIDANCAAEGAACEADSQTGSCGGCAELVSGGSWDTTCDDSKLVFQTFLECICGDGQSAGACN
jgi:hypothetical protein